MGGGWIAVQIDAPRFFQQNVAKSESLGHVSQIRQHAFLGQELAQCGDGFLGVANWEQRMMAGHMALRNPR